MGERLEPSAKDTRVKKFAYGFYSPDQVDQIIHAYITTGSCAAASLVPEAYWSSATVSRVIRAAVAQGTLPTAFKKGTGRPRIDRERISQTRLNHPAATETGLAHILGVSTATLYRAKHGA